MSVSQDEENYSHFTDEKMETFPITSVWTIYTVVWILVPYYNIWSLGDSLSSVYPVCNTSSTLFYYLLNGGGRRYQVTSVVNLLPVEDR